MRLSISNIGWDAEYDERMYGMMGEYGYAGLEIAPTRVFPDKPYDQLEEAKKWAEMLAKRYSLHVSSIQSIWYGRSENMFASQEERACLLDYTKKAIDFAAAMGCGNLVFGCPRNRSLPQGADAEAAIPFFKEAGRYALEKGTVIALEANPVIYHTNYINDTMSALELIRQVDSAGFMLNLDTGTMIQNGEDLSGLAGNVSRINHVHISEPGLRPIERRALHRDLKKILSEEKYAGYISVEMGKSEDLSVVENAMKYVKEVYL